MAKLGYHFFHKDKTRYGDSVYQHLVLRIYQFDFSWDYIADVRWQADPDHNGWYGFRFELSSSLGYSGFKAAKNFMDRMLKADMYKADPLDFVEWLDGLRGSTRLIRDMRVDRLTPIDEYLRTNLLRGYKFYVGSDFIDIILAINKGQAEEIALDNMAQGRYFYRKERLALYPDGWQFDEVRDFYMTPVTLEDWLKIVW